MVAKPACAPNSGPQSAGSNPRRWAQGAKNASAISVTVVAVLAINDKLVGFIAHDAGERGDIKNVVRIDRATITTLRPAAHDFERSFCAHAQP